jgi:hypothetical protein
MISETVIVYSEIYSAKQPECYELECELICLKESLGNDPVANFRVSMEQTLHMKAKKTNPCSVDQTRQVGLTAFISLREGRLPTEFNERQARALMGIEHPALNSRGKVEARWALDKVARELGLEWEELVQRVEDIAREKRRVKELEAKLRA